MSFIKKAHRFFSLKMFLKFFLLLVIMSRVVSLQPQALVDSIVYFLPVVVLPVMISMQDNHF